MSAFYIWNPYISQEVKNKLEFILLNGDIPSGFIYSKEFIRNLITDLGLDEEIKEWFVEPFRTNYYSEYIDEDDWRGIWQIVWKVQVVTKENLKLNMEQDIPWIGTNSVGKGWSDNLDDNSEIKCLIVSDFKSEKSLNNVVAEIFSDEFNKIRENYLVIKPNISQLITLDGYKQLQINLGRFDSYFFSNGAEYAEIVLEICRNEGGITNWEEHE